jgi:hypothetical protein
MYSFADQLQSCHRCPKNQAEGLPYNFGLIGAEPIDLSLYPGASDKKTFLTVAQSTFPVMKLEAGYPIPKVFLIF